MHEKIKTKEIAKRFVSQDCMDLSNIIFSMSKQDRSIFMLASAPYICLVTNEAYEWCRRANISVHPFQSKTILENIRAKAKLFSNDTIVPFEKQRLELENIINIEHNYYKKIAKAYCPDFLIKDVGTYTIRNTYIGNTIQYSYDFQLFSKPNTSIYESGSEIQSFATEIGTKLQEIITILTGKSYSIPQNSCTTQLHSNKDFNFQKKFKKVDNILIFSLVCRINYLLYFFKQNCTKDSMLYLRLIYITFFSLKNELENLRINCDYVFDRYYDRTFRNCMAHYSLFQKIDSNEILASVIGYGLTEKYFQIEQSELIKIIESKLILDFKL